MPLIGIDGANTSLESTQCSQNVRDDLKYFAVIVLFKKSGKFSLNVSEFCRTNLPAATPSIAFRARPKEVLSCRRSREVHVKEWGAAEVKHCWWSRSDISSSSHFTTMVGMILWGLSPETMTTNTTSITRKVANIIKITHRSMTPHQCTRFRSGQQHKLLF